MKTRFVIAACLLLSLTRAVEHPYLLFRAADVPALRKAAASETGQRWIQALEAELNLASSGGFAFHGDTAEAMMEPSWAAGAAFLYLLTENQAYAETAMRWVWSGMYGSLANKNQWRQSYRVQGIALAYDFCAPAWPEDFRRNVYHFLLRQAQFYTQNEDPPERLNLAGRYRYAGETTSRSRSPSDAEHRRFLAAAGLAALAIRHDTPLPYRPTPPDQIPWIEAADDLLLVPGIPVVTLTSGHMFGEWLANGPFPASDPDPLRALGGFANARPLPGTRVESLGESLDFRPYRRHASPEVGPTFYPRDCMRFFTRSTGSGFPPGKRLAKALREKEGPEARLAVALYTLWRVDEEICVRAYPNLYWSSRGVRMWVNGREVKDDQAFRLRPGLYPVMVHMPVTGGYALQAPHFRVYRPEEYEEERLGAETASAWFADHPEFPDGIADTVAGELQRFLRDELASDGSETRGLAEQVPLFAQAYRQATGKDILATSPWSQLPLHAALWLGMPDSQDLLRGSSQILPFLRDKEASLGHWLLQNTPPPLRRPSEAILPILALLNPSPALSPAEYPGPSFFGTNIPGAHLLRTSPGTPQGRLLGMAAGPAPQLPLSLQFASSDDANGPHSWIHPPPALQGSPEWAALPGIVGEPPATQAAEVLHAEATPEGILRLRMRSGRIERSLWFDSRAETPLLVIADTFHDVNRREEKTLRYYLSHDLHSVTWIPNEQILRSRRGDQLLEIKLLSPRPLQLVKKASNQEASRGSLIFRLDPAPRDTIRESENRLLLAGEVSNIALEFGDELKQTELKADVETLTLISILRISAAKDTSPPEVEWNPPHLRIGHLRLLWQDGLWHAQP
jgi:hypothetical protein